MRTSLANVDAAWHRMEEPTNRMVVTGVLVFDKPISMKQLRGLVEKRLLRFSRFRQRIVEPRGPLSVLSWEEDPDFSVEHHLATARLPGRGTEAALQSFTSELASQAFLKGRPPWKFHFVPRYQGGSALIVRLHHSIGDGLALVHVLLSMADGAPAPPEPRRREVNPEGLLNWVRTSLAGVAEAALTLPWRASKGGLPLLSSPARLVRSGADAANHLASLVRLLLLPPDPHTAFKGALGRRKKLVWSRPFPLGDFKAASGATDTTVNDVLMTALAGALRRYLLGRGAVPRGLDIRAVVPVNLRPAAEAHLLGNRFGLVFLSLPLGLEDTFDRLQELHRRMLALKKSPDPAATFGLLWVMGQLPRAIFDLVVDLFGTKATTVVTNVVGPKEAISLLGVPLRQAMFWVPCAGHLGLGVSLLSYAGRVWVGVQADVGLIPHPEQILANFELELKALRAGRRAQATRRSRRTRKARTTRSGAGSAS
jgi:diacylglycerol O-acyltransferase / wax synthase